MGSKKKPQGDKDESSEKPSQISAFSLDDAASLVVQIEPGNIKGVVRLQSMINELARQHSAIPNLGHLLVEASWNLDLLLQNKGEEWETTLSQTGKLIEQAALALDTASEPSGDSHAETISDESAPSVHVTTSDKSSEASPTVVPFVPPDSDPTLLADFINESRDYMEAAEAALLTLEMDPEDQEAVNTVFRAFHTVKGTSAFLGLASITGMAHKAESLLSRMRDRQIRCVGGYADLALRSADMLKALIESVQQSVSGKPTSEPEGYAELLQLLANPESAGVSEATHTEGENPLRVGDILVAQGKISREKMEQVASQQGRDNIGEAILKSKAAKASDVAMALRTQKKISGSQSPAESSVRVRTDRLDRLIDTVGELVIGHSMLAQDTTVRSSQHHDLLRKVSHAGKIVRELQGLSMSMRMVPLKTTFQKMARLVRDLAHKSGKQVDFVSSGEDTEIDRNMVDIIADPLVHMVRNAVDHGIEPPAERQQKGKASTGKVRLSAYHAGGNVVVELEDDGKGLDRGRILAKAIEKGLVDADKNLTESEIFNLIFAPGFSTAEKITDVSGRGVGMDVVRRNVEALRGRIDISSEPSKGTVFVVRLPLTLAITDGMLVQVGAQRYIIPTTSIHLSFRPRPEMLSTLAGRGEMVMLRGELMPVFRLHRLFDVNGAVEEPVQGLLVVIADGERRCALLVDELLGQQQVVAKSLGEGLGKVPGVSGGAILGDGRVGLILDPAEVIALARQPMAFANMMEPALAV